MTQDLRGSCGYPAYFERMIRIIGEEEFSKVIIQKILFFWPFNAMSFLTWKLNLPIIYSEQCPFLNQLVSSFKRHLSSLTSLTIGVRAKDIFGRSWSLNTMAAGTFRFRKEAKLDVLSELC